MFVCPDCGESKLIKVVPNATLIIDLEVVEYTDGPYDLEEMDLQYEQGSGTYWECKDCGWMLPCRSEEEVIDFIRKSVG